MVSELREVLRVNRTKAQAKESYDKMSPYLSGGTQSVPGMGTFRKVKMRHFMT
jgi:hypothetical protein